jgi:ribosomal-protein-alanine N-acetyltransferase
MAFRELGSEDAEALVVCFERNAVPAITDTFDPFPLDAEHALRIATAPGRDHYYGLFDEDGRIVGVSMLRGWDEGYEIPSFGMFVDHEHHGRGIGSRLLDETLRAAGTLAAPAVRLSVYRSNAVAERMYRSRGFSERERGTVQRNGTEDVRIVMQRAG